ncbi:MAG: hypothetical protein IKA46_06670 [Clostridia bacterium]|nr:hypothetical protein [Clostridia bacterium]
MGSKGEHQKISQSIALPSSGAHFSFLCRGVDINFLLKSFIQNRIGYDDKGKPKAAYDQGHIRTENQKLNQNRPPSARYTRSAARDEKGGKERIRKEGRLRTVASKFASLKAKKAKSVEKFIKILYNIS